MSTAAIGLSSLLPEAAARVLDYAALNQGLVALVSVGYAGEQGWAFRYALSFMNPALEVERFVWLDSLPQDAASTSNWQEGNFRLSTGPGDLVAVTNKAGRCLWFDMSTRKLALVEERPGAGVSPAWDEQGRYLALSTDLDPARRHLRCGGLVRGKANAGAVPEDWEALPAFGAELLDLGLHHPWVHQVVALGEGRWLVGIVTDGSVKSAYPSKSMPYRYVIVDGEGACVARVDHAAASRSKPINVYANIDEALFPAAYHPFYPMVRDRSRPRLLHKLLDQLLVFDLDGQLRGQIDFGQKGLSGMRKLELRAVTSSGHAVFSSSAHATLWSIELGELADIPGQLAEGLKVYRKAHKALGGGRVGLHLLDGVSTLMV